MNRRTFLKSTFGLGLAGGVSAVLPTAARLLVFADLGKDEWTDIFTPDGWTAVSGSFTLLGVGAGHIRTHTILDYNTDTFTDLQPAQTTTAI